MADSKDDFKLEETDDASFDVPNDENIDESPVENVASESNNDFDEEEFELELEREMEGDSRLATDFEDQNVSKKQKVKKRKKLQFIHDDEPAKKDSDDDDDEDEDVTSLKQTSYDLFIKGLENALARVDEGEIAEINAFDKNMNPTLKLDKTRVLLRQINYIRVGDVMLHNTRYGKYSLRRVIKIKDDEFYLLGDAENRYTIVKRENLLAKVVAKIDGNKYFSFNASLAKKKIGQGKVKNAGIRTLGRIVTATDEDLNYLHEQEALAVEAENKVQGEAVAKLVQNDKMESLDDSAKMTFSTKIDETKGLDQEVDANATVASKQEKQDEFTPSGFSTAVSNDVPDDIGISIGGANGVTSSQVSDDNSYDSNAFQASSAADMFNEAKNASFGSKKAMNTAPEFETKKSKKDKKKKKNDSDDDAIPPTTTNNGGFQTSTSNDSFNIPEGPSFESQTGSSPSQSNDDDLPPIDFNK